MPESIIVPGSIRRMGERWIARLHVPGDKADRTVVRLDQMHAPEPGP